MAVLRVGICDFFLNCRNNSYRKPLNKLSTRQLRRRIVNIQQNIVNECNACNSFETEISIGETNVQQKGKKEVTYQNINNKICINDKGDDELSLVNNSSNADNTLSLGNLEFQMANMNNHKCNDNNIEVQSKNLKDELSEWAVQNNIRLNALSRLLKIVKPHVSETLPLDARTLLKTPRQTLIREVLPGEYYHFGVYKGIIQFLKSHSRFASIKNDVEIMVNIDGLPISASSNSQLWPILCSVFQYNHVFMVGLYHGKNKKPESSNDFLSDFIHEICDMTINGIFYDGKTYGFKIKGFSVDCPAKSFMLCIKGHGGYSSCTKCMTEGEYVEHRICFPNNNASLRTDFNLKIKRMRNIIQVKLPYLKYQI